MQLTALQKAAAQAIVNIFETGSIRGNYSDVTLMSGDTGQLTYGRSQTTLASGNLFLLIQDYAGNSAGAYCTSFQPYLGKLQTCDASLNGDMQFRGLLKDAGEDPVMQECQDAFFDRVYWDPAMRSADAIGVKTALGAAIVYDSTVHGSWPKIRDRVRHKYGELAAIGEDTWIAHYVDERRDWLATNGNALLHKCVYRMDAFKQIIHAGNWKLNLPVVVRGLNITADVLTNPQPVRVSAAGTPQRLLYLHSPPLTGPDVSWIQDRLTRAGFHVESTGVFDAQTDSAVRAFQGAHDLKVDGMVGQVTRSALEDVAVTVPAKSAAADEPMPAVASPQAAVAPAAAHSAAHAPAPPSASASEDPVADIKQHVSNEVRAGVDSIRQEIQHNATKTALKPVAVPHAPAPSHTAVKAIVPGRTTTWAAGLSALMLALTQLRDFFAWVEAEAVAPALKSVAVIHPFPALPTSTADFGRFGSQFFVYAQGIAAQLPPEWVFRIRAAAFLLICFALYRLGVRSSRLKKLEADIAEAQSIEGDVEQVVGAAKALR
jgi:chitosanase